MSLKYLVGCPRSGKSTYAAKWVNEKPKRIVVCADTFRKAVYDKTWWRDGESMAYATAYAAVRAFLLDGYEVLYDDTNTSDESLKRLFALDENATPIVIDTPMDVCLKRAVELDQSYLIPVIARCCQNLSLRISHANSTRWNEPSFSFVEGIERYCKTYFNQLRKKND
jgi:predicted kinase